MIVAALGLEARHGAARGAAGHADLDRQVEHQGEIGPMRAEQRRLQGVDQLQAEPAGAALVDAGGVGEAVAQHPAAAVEGGQDRAVEMVLAGGQEEVELGQRAPALGRPVTISSRIASAPSVPPGSRVTRQSRPRARRSAARRRSCVLLPAPSPPSMRDEPAARHASPHQVAGAPQIR